MIQYENLINQRIKNIDIIPSILVKLTLTLTLVYYASNA